jgi:hypothetical protein
MRDRDFQGNLVHINHRFDLSRLNVACEGLLLGMRAEGHTEFLMKPRRINLHFHHNCQHTFVSCFTGGGDLAR